MADVFLSYAREDAVRARQVAQALEQAGLEVFWDNEIPPGATWADHIELKLSQCKALIVLWSKDSTKSQSVREEARLARDKGVLIPVSMDGSTPPFGFGEVQTADLSHWTGDLSDPGWRRVVDAVSRVAERQPAPIPPPPVQSAYTPPPPVAPAAVSAPVKAGVSPWVWVGGAVAVAVIVLAAFGFFMQSAQQVASNAPAPVQPVAQQPPATGGVSYEQQILARLAQAEQHFAAQGFQQLAPPVSGQLPPGQFANVPVTLQAGGDYRIIGVCDNDCGDFDLILYDQNNNVVSQDNLPDPTPIVAVSPQWSGPFTVQAVMQNCTIAPCYYALVLYGRPLTP